MDKPRTSIPQYRDPESYRAELRRNRRWGYIWGGIFLVIFGILPTEFTIGVVLSYAAILAGLLLIVFGAWALRRETAETSTGPEANDDA